MNTASIIIADENEGRRNLLANTFEREGYDVTRLGTLAQTEATAGAVLPDVLLMEGEWATGSALDVCQTLAGQARFRTATRTVLLSRTTAPDFLSSAALAGVAEVIGKPVDMNQLISQIGRHAAKQFVPPPAEVAVPQGGGLGGGQRFDVSMTMNDSQWALPMLRRLVEAGNIDEAFVQSIREEMGEADDEGEAFSSETMTTMVRLALNRLVGSEGEPETSPPTEEAPKEEDSTPDAGAVPTFNTINKGATLGEGAAPTVGSSGVGSSMEDILEKQAEDIARTVEGEMDAILDEAPEYVALLEQEDQVGIDPETLALTRLTAEVLRELMEALKRPGALSDLTLLTQVEDASVLAADMLDALPSSDEEE
ncbi:MAG: response regulator [Candidatus Thermoplasmatota archaeon]|nr:response regulator [Candidatus Thermoplasmatota archaeon]